MKKINFLFLFFSLIFCLAFVSAGAVISGLPNRNLEFNDFASFNVATYTTGGHLNVSTTVSFSNPDNNQQIILYGDSGGQHSNSKFAVSLDRTGYIQILSNNIEMTSRPITICVSSQLYTTESCGTFYLSITETSLPEQILSLNNINLTNLGGYYTINFNNVVLNYDRVSVSYTDTVVSSNVYLFRNKWNSNTATYRGGIKTSLIPLQTGINLYLENLGYAVNYALNLTFYNSVGQISIPLNVTYDSDTSLNFCYINGAECVPPVTTNGNLLATTVSGLTGQAFSTGYISKLFLWSRNTGLINNPMDIKGVSNLTIIQNNTYVYSKLIDTNSTGWLNLEPSDYISFIQPGNFTINYVNLTGSGSNAEIYVWFQLAHAYNVTGWTGNNFKYWGKLSFYGNKMFNSNTLTAYSPTSDQLAKVPIVFNSIPYSTIPSLFTEIPDYTINLDDTITIPISQYFLDEDRLNVYIEGLDNYSIIYNNEQIYRVGTPLYYFELEEYAPEEVNLRLDSKSINDNVNFIIEASNLLGSINTSFTITMGTTTTGNEGNTITQTRNWLNGLFPSSNTLKNQQKLSYIFVTIFLIMFFCIIAIGLPLKKLDFGFKLGITLSILSLFWFIGIGYIGVSVLIIAVLGVALYLYINKGGL